MVSVTGILGQSNAAFELTPETRVVCDTSDRMLRTACEDFCRVVRVALDVEIEVVAPPPQGADYPPCPGNAVVIGTGYENPYILGWMEEGKLGIRDYGKARSAFEIRVVDGVLVVAGSNPDSVPDGVFCLEEMLLERTRSAQEPAERAPAAVGKEWPVPVRFSADTQETVAPFFEWRIFHPRSPAGGGFFDYTREDFAAIRRRGGNTALMMHDWMGEKSLYRFVPSEVFPDAIDPEELERNRAALRRYIEWAKDYGLRVALWICEMPCQGGPWMSEEARAAFLERYPEEVLSDTGTYQGKVVCLGHPRVEEYYRELMRGLLTDFPEVALIQLFTLDSNAEFCSPEACPRHQGVSKIEQRDRLIRLILEEGRKVQPDFRVLTTTWGWQNHPEFLERQAALPAGSGLFSTPDGEAWSFDRKLTDYLVRQRDLCRDRGQMFLGYDIFLWGDDVLFPPYERIYDFPFGIAAKLRRWAHVRADGVFDQWGTEPDLLACNSMALRAFLFDPFQEPEPVLERIAERQFGAAAAPHVLDAWRAIEAAQQVQSDHTYYWHALRHGWSGGIIKIPPTIEALAPLDGIYSREPHKPAGPIDHAPGDDIERARQLGAAMRDVVAHFDAAVVATERALKALEPDHRSFYADLLTDAAPVSPREHLERQLRTLRLCSGLQRELGHFFEAFAIVKDMNGADQETRENLRVKHQALMRETLEGTRALRQLLDEIGVGDSDMAACLDERAAGLEPAVSKDLDPKDAK